MSEDENEVLLAEDEPTEVIDLPKARSSSSKGEVMEIPIAKKSDIVTMMSKYSRYKTTVCSECFDAMIASVRQLIRENNHVYVRGLGTFVLRRTKRRKMIMYGKALEIRPLKKVSFKISQSLVTSVRQEILDESEDEE